MPDFCSSLGRPALVTTRNNNAIGKIGCEVSSDPPPHNTVATRNQNILIQAAPLLSGAVVAMPMPKNMHQRTCKQEKIGKREHDVAGMGEEKIDTQDG